MVYVVPYEADFECPKGHRFTMTVGFNAEGKQARCPHCYEEWVASNVPCGKQVSKPRQKPHEVSIVYD